MTIAILGAGEIGSATVRQLAASDVASRIVLVDEAGAVAAGKALDIAQAGPVDRYVSRVTGTDDVTAVAGAGVIIVADRASGGEWADDAGLALLRRVSGCNGSAPIPCAGVQHGTLLDRAVHELGLARARIFGTAPEALRAGVVSLVALEADAAPADVVLTVVGRAPGELIVPWDAASIAGRRAIDVLPPPALSRLEARLPRLWPPGPMALGAAAALVVRSMLTRAPRVHALQVSLPRAESPSGRSAILPSRVHADGILRIEVPALSSRDRVRLDTALAR